MALPPVECFARVGSLHYVYSEAAEKAYCDFLKKSEEYGHLDPDDYDENHTHVRYDKLIAGLQTVVFSAMCFEAAIYDFASIYLGDDYVREHLDKLDVLSKWLVVLRLVSGIEIPKDEAPYCALKVLVTERNRLVHSKSEAWGYENQHRQILKMLKREGDFKKSVHNAVRALILMSLYIEKVHKGHHNPLPSFSKCNAPMRRYFNELESTINDCRVVVAKLGRG